MGMEVVMVLGGRLELMTLEVFSNLNNSMNILHFSFQLLFCCS